MTIQYSSSGHWTDEQLIASFYGVGPEDGHLAACHQCQARSAVLNANRQAIEMAKPNDEFAGSDLLAAQRRAIYEKLEPAPWWSVVSAKRLASVAATALVLLGGAVVYEEQQSHHGNESQVSDAQLAQEVSSMSQESEAQPTAPLQGLFE